MKITIRQEEEKDYAYVENMTREAFWDVYQPGASEHFVLHKLRKSDCFIPNWTSLPNTRERSWGTSLAPVPKSSTHKAKHTRSFAWAPSARRPKCKDKALAHS